MFALPRGLSQLATSFVASQSQGIRPAPLLPDFNSQDRQPLETLTFDLGLQNLRFYCLRY